MLRRLFSTVLVLSVLMGLHPASPAVGSAGVRIEDDIVVRSRDGTPIVATLMLPSDASARNKVPVIIGTHGWGGSRATTPSGLVARLLDRGYAVLTWDSRGFGESGGEANIGAPGYEVADARALITYLSRRPEIRKDGPGDPRLGWIGGSNAGGVQLNTAAVDRRIDAIVPEISWGDLLLDLIPNGVPKQTWDVALYGAGLATGTALGLQSPAGPQTGSFPPQIHQAFAEATATGNVSESIREWFAFRSTTTRSHRVRAPTLIIQGTIDTLFPLEDAFVNYRQIRRAGTPVKLITYCSGHTLAGCSYPGGAGSLPHDRIVAWLNHYVKGRQKVRTGSAVEWQAQDGLYHRARRWPLQGNRWVTGTSLSTGQLAGPGSSGGDAPADGNPAPPGELGVTAARDAILGPLPRPRAILGIPRVHLAGNVTGLRGYVFMELVDLAPDGSRVTVDDQVMPVGMAGGSVDATFDLHGVSWLLEPGHVLELELTTGSAQYRIPSTGPFGIDLTATTMLPLARA